jgi:glycine/D-amino acid oxidase-like deaminating enzyme
MGAYVTSPLHNGSLWFDTLEAPLASVVIEPLPDKVDVAIIGAGYTGLWTAYYLLQHSPGLKVALFEANTVGFGASGRNGGWCMGWAMGIEQLLAQSDRAAEGLAVARAMQRTVDEIGSVAEHEGIDCHFVKGGTIKVATRPFDALDMQAKAAHRREQGFDAADFVWLDAAASKARVNMSANYGALYTPHCARIHPARLALGLARVLREQGVKIYEHTPVSSFSTRELVTNRGTVLAQQILRATEGYTDSIKGQQRQLLPLYSMMVATQPLPASTWDSIGLKQHETFGDARRVTIYGQRTADDRLAFGGRAGYYFGSRRIPVIDPADPMLEHVAQTLLGLFPVLQPAQITHRWGGLMGVQRHWRPFVTFNAESGLGSAGGYTGEGVGASNLAARILVDLVLGRETDIRRLSWGDDVARRWEPEPLRWLGAGAIQWFGDRADRREFVSGKPSRFWGGLFDRFVG